MFCKNCGKKIDDDSKFCVYCGTAVSIIKEENTTSQQAETPVDATDENQGIINNTTKKSETVDSIGFEIKNSSDNATSQVKQNIPDKYIEAQDYKQVPPNLVTVGKDSQSVKEESIKTCDSIDVQPDCVVEAGKESAKEKCLFCGAVIPENSDFCPYCGKKIEIEKPKNLCTICKADIPAGSEFCPFCGNKQNGRKDLHPLSIEKKPLPKKSILKPIKEKIIPSFQQGLKKALKKISSITKELISNIRSRDFGVKELVALIVAAAVFIVIIISLVLLITSIKNKADIKILRSLLKNIHIITYPLMS